MFLCLKYMSVCLMITRRAERGKNKSIIKNSNKTNNFDYSIMLEIMYTV